MKINLKPFTQRVLIGLLVIMTLCIWGVSVQAEETFKLNIDQYKAKDGKLFVYANQNQKSHIDFAKEDSSLLVGKQNLAIEDIKPFKETKEPVSYLMIVDISGSMDSSRIDQVKEILTQFVDEKKEADNFNIVTMGDNLNSTGFLSDKDELKKSIDTIKVTKEDTNLYYAIKEELNALNSDENVFAKRGMVIFSDGAEDQATGITREEVETVVKDSHIPIFTVALMSTKPDDNDIEIAKVLGSFARDSAGGEHFAPQVDGTSYSDVCDKIYQTIDNSLVFTADLADLKIGDETVYIEVGTTNGSVKAKDGMTVPAGKIKEQIETAKKMAAKLEVKVVKEKEEPTPVQESDKDDSYRLYYLIGGILVVILIILVVTIIVCKKRKKKVEYEEQDSSKYDFSNNEFDYSAQIDNSLDVFSASGTETVTAAPILEKNPKKVKFVMSKIGPGEELKYELSIKNEVTIGRKSSCKLCLKEDNALSSIHCSVFYRDGNVYIKDQNSTNGTFVNGVPIVGEFMVSRDDVLLIGSNEYRIYWE